MRTHATTTLMAITMLCNTVTLAADDSILREPFDFTVARSPQPQLFDMETVVITYAPDGKRINTDILRLQLKCVPGKDAEEYTCLRFALKFGDNPEVTVPAIANWSYPYKATATGMDEKGQVFGIDHAKFEKLLDSNGQPLPVDKAYYVYNAFIDFHGFCNAFAEPTTGGKGIQDLKKIGDKIVHAAANTEPPVNLGSGIKEGSTFKNGEVTLEFKGLSLVDNAPCAIIAFDSGQSSFQMTINPMPNMEVRSVGASHYKGDIHIDLASRWPRKVTMDELVVAQSTVPMLANKISAVIERNTIIRNISAKAQD